MREMVSHQKCTGSFSEFYLIFKGLLRRGEERSDELNFRMFPFSLLIPSFLHHLLYIQDFVVKFCLGAEKRRTSPENINHR